MAAGFLALGIRGHVYRYYADELRIRRKFGGMLSIIAGCRIGNSLRILDIISNFSWYQWLGSAQTAVRSRSGFGSPSERPFAPLAPPRYHRSVITTAPLRALCHQKNARKGVLLGGISCGFRAVKVKTVKRYSLLLASYFLLLALLLLVLALSFARRFSEE